MIREFENLSETQKRYVIVLGIKRPGHPDEITSSYVRELHHELLDERAKGGVKVGWPRWVFTENLVSKSLGFVPRAPESAINDFMGEKTELLSSPIRMSNSRVKLNLVTAPVTDDEFERELFEAGIT